MPSFKCWVRFSWHSSCKDSLSYLFHDTCASILYPHQLFSNLGLTGRIVMFACVASDFMHLSPSNCFLCIEDLGPFLLGLVLTWQLQLLFLFLFFSFMLIPLDGPAGPLNWSNFWVLTLVNLSLVQFWSICPELKSWGKQKKHKEENRKITGEPVHLSVIRVLFMCVQVEIRLCNIFFFQYVLEKLCSWTLSIDNFGFLRTYSPANLLSIF